MTTSVENNSVFRSFFKKQKLTGPNFIDWYRQLQLILSTEDKEKYLEQPIPAAPVGVAPDQPIPSAALTTYNEWVKNQKEIAVMILLTIDLEIQQNLAHLDANDMLIELKALYSKQAEHELLQIVREFHTCKQEEGQSIVASIEQYSDLDEMSVEEAIGRLKTFEERIKVKKGKAFEDQDKLLFAKHNDNGRRHHYDDQGGGRYIPPHSRNRDDNRQHGKEESFSQDYNEAMKKPRDFSKVKCSKLHLNMVIIASHAVLKDQRQQKTRFSMNPVKKILEPTLV
ncbi:hypothetical protein Tco_1070747 [Tanacetum coccineum]|uniref:Zinc finger, CCHC-type n=1 Tax=Tanacetum coccineum TaxID=301880 RepID=A0ABQ5HMB4_9ASTR